VSRQPKHINYYTPRRKRKSYKHQDKDIHEAVLHMVPSFQQFTSIEDWDYWESYHLRIEQHFKAYKVETEDEKRAFSILGRI
jgi:hypothetical protein